jgi:hypothetical protein
VPQHFRGVIGLSDGDIARIIDTSPRHNLNTFARGLAKIAYCNAVMKYGDGFRPLATRSIILGRYPNIAYFVGSDPTTPSPPYPRGCQHSVPRFDHLLSYQVPDSDYSAIWRQRCGRQRSAFLHSHLWIGRQASRHPPRTRHPPAMVRLALARCCEI